MKRTIVNFALSTGILVISLTGCRKDENQETTTGIDNGIAETHFNDLYSVVNNSAADNGFAGFTAPDNSANKTSSSDCPTVTFSEPFGTFPNTMTIDFGTGCTGYFGVERSGKVIATFTGLYMSEGTVITVVPEDYYVNGVHIEGTKTVTNLGLNDAGNMYFSVVVADAVITLTDGSDIEYNSTREREWVEGSSTADIHDDVYSITGSSAGINRLDIPFAMSITEALRKEMDCHWIVSGKVEITPEGEETRTIDYGEGECDNEAILTVGSFTITITLPF
ncbi:MAG: hypothetical protein ACKVPJ_14320 [Chitinophagales bacterium]